MCKFLYNVRYFRHCFYRARLLLCLIWTMLHISWLWAHIRNHYSRISFLWTLYSQWMFCDTHSEGELDEIDRWWVCCWVVGLWSLWAQYLRKHRPLAKDYVCVKSRSWKCGLITSDMRVFDSTEAIQYGSQACIKVLKSMGLTKLWIYTCVGRLWGIFRQKIAPRERDKESHDPYNYEQHQTHKQSFKAS